LIELAIDPARGAVQEAPSAKAADHEEAHEILSQARTFKAEETASDRQERIEEDV
jgi:hypothetical protein